MSGAGGSGGGGRGSGGSGRGGAGALGDPGGRRRGGAGPEPVNPAGLGAPFGYSHGMLAPSGARLLCVAGQIGWDADRRLVGPGFVEQFERALANVLEVVAAAGGGPEHLLRLTLYVTDKNDYLSDLEAIGDAYRRLMGRRYPAMALVEVAALLEDGARVEIEGTAAVP